MIWFVTGARGMLGHRLVERLQAAGQQVSAPEHLDITIAPAVDEAIQSAGPDVVVNAAAYTAVDAAETDEERATAVNGTGAGNVAQAAARHGAAVLQISTDYVFDGHATEPYDEEAATAPVSAYGRSKAAGEAAVLQSAARAAVVRTAWLYGPGGANFVSTMLRLERERDVVQVVDDQVGQPTSTDVVVDALLALAPQVVAGSASGCFHATCRGQTSWHGLACEVFRLAGADPARVQPTTSKAFVRPAPRPAFSVLSHRRWTEPGLPAHAFWTDALRTTMPMMSAG
jgi:dTDP-4-dehydrorhamnose reductase